MFTIGEVLQKDIDHAKAVLLPPPRPETDVTQLLVGGGVVVVVGGRPSNFSQEHLQNPRIVFWHSTDPKAFRSKSLPANAKAVLFVGGFIDHPTEGRIRRQAKDKGIYAPGGFLMTGVVKTTLDKMLTRPIRVVVEPAPRPMLPPPVPAIPAAIKEEHVAPAAAVNVTARRFMPGELKNFVMTHADATQRPAHEAHRLLPLLIAKGIQTTFVSVEQAVRFYVTVPYKAAKAQAMSEATASREFRELMAETPPGVRPAPKKQPAATNVLIDQIAQALSMAADVKAQADLLTEALTKIQTDVQRLRSTQQTLREFLD